MLLSKGYSLDDLNEMIDDRLYPVRQVARYAGRSEHFVRCAIKSGELSSVRPSPNKTMIFGRHAKEWIGQVIFRDISPPRFEENEAAAVDLIAEIRSLPVTKMDGRIYFIKCGAWVKIGFSVDEKLRMSDLQAGNPMTLSTMGSIAGSRSFEWAIHQVLKRYRHRGEWFRLAPEVRLVIKELCK